MSSGETVVSGTGLGSWEIVRKLGSGAFADVYLARHATLQSLVALKVIRSAAYTDRELQGARLMTQLRHPNLVTVLDAKWADDRLLIAMDYVEGETLAAAIGLGVPLPPQRVVEVAIQIVAGLVQIHEARWPDDSRAAHLDLKPTNILLGKDGTVKITDFGIAQLVGSPGARMATEGSPSYMAPEQFEGAPTQSSDIWAVGMLIFRMLFGRALIDPGALSEYPSLVRRGLEELPDRLGGAPDQIRAVVAACLRWSPSDRLPSARALYEALAAIDLNSPVRRSCSQCGGAVAPGAECPDCTLVIKKPPVKHVDKKDLFRAPQVPNRVPVHTTRVLIGIAIILVIAAGWFALPRFALSRKAVSTGGGNLQRMAPVPVWSHIQDLVNSVDGDASTRIAALSDFIHRYPDDLNDQAARSLLADWETDKKAVDEAIALAAGSGIHMSEALGRWRSVELSARTRFAKVLAGRQAAMWQDRLDRYDGFAVLTVVSADGIPPVHRLVLGDRLPSSYFVVVQDGHRLYRSRTVVDTPDPNWNERVRVAAGRTHEVKVEIWSTGILADAMLLDQRIQPLPPDGSFAVSAVGVMVRLSVEREE